MTVGFGVATDADRLLRRRDRLLVLGGDVVVGGGVVVGDDVVVGGGVVVGDDFLVAVLIFSALAPLLRERGPEDGVAENSFCVGSGVATDVFSGWRREFSLLLCLFGARTTLSIF